MFVVHIKYDDMQEKDLKYTNITDTNGSKIFLNFRNESGQKKFIIKYVFVENPVASACLAIWQ